MLGVPPKSSGGATNRCVMSRLTKCAVPDPFQTVLSQACRARSCRSCGGAGVQRLCALRSRGLSVEHADVLAAGPDNAGYRWSRHSTFRRLNRGCCEGSDPPSRQADWVDQMTVNLAPFDIL